MVQPKYSPQESLERVKLMMKYDISKTLNENKEIIKEQTDIQFTTTQTSGLPTWINNYPCLLQNNLGTLKKTNTDKAVVIFLNNGDKIFFWLIDGLQKCTLLYSNGTKLKGSWSCKDSNYVLKNPVSLYIQFDNGDVYNGDKFVKADDAQNTKVIEKLKTDDTSRQSKYTTCNDTLPIKQMCKNETVRKVQACLKMPKRYQTGNFGPITQEYLESRDQNGTLITTETIINVCGANNPLVKDTGTGTPATGTPATGTPATGTPATGTPASGTPAAGTPDEIEQVDADDSIDLLNN